MWYTLTGNFGDLLPINYWSKPSLIRKYHSESLNLKQLMHSSGGGSGGGGGGGNKKRVVNRRELDLNLDSYENLLNKSGSASDEDEECDENEFNSDYEDEPRVSGKKKRNSARKRSSAAKNRPNIIDINEEDLEDYLELDGGDDDDDDDDEDDEDLHELREQLDMHSMILSKSLYEGAEFDEPIVTAEQVLNEIDSMMNMARFLSC
jgi:hypothetical protein